MFILVRSRLLPLVPSDDRFLLNGFEVLTYSNPSTIITSMLCLIVYTLDISEGI